MNKQFILGSIILLASFIFIFYLGFVKEIIYIKYIASIIALALILLFLALIYELIFPKKKNFLGRLADAIMKL